MTTPHQSLRDQQRSLDLVQRVVLSVLVVVVFGSLAAVLSAYVALSPELSGGADTIVLWALTGAIGLVTTAVVLAINRRRPYSPWLLLGLLPMAISAFWIFG